MNVAPHTARPPNSTLVQRSQLDPIHCDVVQHNLHDRGKHLIGYSS